jgi:hypothetical protein
VTNDAVVSQVTSQKNNPVDLSADMPKKNERKNSGPFDKDSYNNYENDSVLTG